MSEIQKVSNGCYMYRGFKVINCGYHHPDHSVVWEATDETGNIIIHGYSRKEALMRIDEYIEKHMK